MKPTHGRALTFAGLLVLIVALLATACAPAAAPTPTPTKAAPASTAAATKPAGSPTAAATAAATKPAAPAATPTTAAAKPAGAPVKIGYLTPLTGPTAPFGQLETIAVVLAEEDVNASGGINGSPLQVIKYDSPFDPQQAVTMVRKLAGDDKAFAILGPFSSGEFDVAAPLANQLQIPVIGMKTSKPGFSQQYRPWEFRVTMLDDGVASAVTAAFKKQNPNLKNIVIVGDTKENVTANMVNVIWPKALKDAGLNVAGTVGYESGTTDFSAIVTKIKSMNPEAIAYSATPKADPVGFSKELATQQVKVPVFASQHYVNGGFVYQAGPAMEGWLAVAYINTSSPDPKIQDFNKRFEAKLQSTPNMPKGAQLTVEANAYDVVNIVADIMRKANIKPDTGLAEARTKIRDGMAAVKDYKGVVGTINMQPDGDATFPGSVVIAKNGQWTNYQ